MATEKETHQVRNLKTGFVCHLGSHDSCETYIENTIWLNVGFTRQNFSIETKGMK